MNATTSTAKRKRRAARYVVMSKSLWQGDDWSPITSEIFTSRKSAQEYADANENHGSDLRDVLNTRVFTWTEAVKHYSGHEDELWNAISYRDHVETQFA